MQTSQDQPSGASQRSRYFQTEDASPHSRLATRGTDFYPNPKPAASRRGMLVETPRQGLPWAERAEATDPAGLWPARDWPAPRLDWEVEQNLEFIFMSIWREQPRKPKGQIPLLEGSTKYNPKSCLGFIYFWLCWIRHCRKDFSLVWPVGAPARGSARAGLAAAAPLAAEHEL